MASAGKRGCGGAGTRRVPKSCLESDGRREGRSKATGVRRRDGCQHLARPSLGLLTKRRKGVCSCASQSWAEHHAAFEHDTIWYGAISLAIEGATTAGVFEAYVERVLAPNLRPAQVVIMDNLSAHKTERVRELVEQGGASSSTCHRTLRT